MTHQASEPVNQFLLLLLGRVTGHRVDDPGLRGLRGLRGHGGPFRPRPTPDRLTRPSGAPRRTGVGTQADQLDPDLTQKIGQNLRFTTLAALANELQEAQGNRELARVVGRYARTELLILDELGFLALLDGAAEPVSQVLFERHKRGCLIVTTNLQFGDR